MGKANMVERELEQTILGLATAFENEGNGANVGLIQKLYERFDYSEKLYECEMGIAFHDFGRFAAMPWLSKHPHVTNGWDKFYIESIYSGLLSHYVRKIIEKNEGSPCSGDKESFVIAKIKQSIDSGENISLYQTYEGQERIAKDKWNEQAYWSPKSFKDTDDVKAKFKAWYMLEE